MPAQHSPESPTFHTRTHARQVISPAPVTVNITAPTGNVTGGRLVGLVSSAGDCIGACTFTWSVFVQGTAAANKTGSPANYTVGVGPRYELDMAGRTTSELLAVVTAADAANRTASATLRFWVRRAQRLGQREVARVLP